LRGWIIAAPASERLSANDIVTRPVKPVTGRTFSRRSTAVKTHNITETMG
jgi:hypothetical protein